MIMFKSSNVYGVCKWNQVKSYTDSAVNTLSSIPDAVYVLRAGISKLLLQKLNRKSFGLGRTCCLHHPVQTAVVVESSHRQHVNGCAYVSIQLSFATLKSEIVNLSCHKILSFFDFKKKIHLKIEIYSWCAVQKQVASQIWLMGHGLLIPGLEDV